jgi:hypothetical protein
VLGFFHVHQVNACLVDQGSRLKSPLGDFLAIFGQTATFVPEKVHMVTNARMREKYRCASMKRGISPRLIPEWAILVTGCPRIEENSPYDSPPNYPNPLSAEFSTPGLALCGIFHTRSRASLRDFAQECVNSSSTGTGGPEADQSGLGFSRLTKFG